MSGLVSSFFVVWRETFESLLIVFMLWTALGRQGLWKNSRPFVFAGIAAGLLLSGIIAWGVLFLSEGEEGSLALFLQAFFPILAAGLMLHMVAWMSSHAKEISGEIKEMVTTKTGWTLTWGIFALVAYAVSREGFETFVYLYGMSMNPANAHLGAAHYSGVLLAGTAASCLSLLALKKGLSFFNLKLFFRATNLFLLCTAASLLVIGINRMIENEYIPSLVDPLWNSSDIVSGESFFGQLLNMLLGYTPQPSLMLVIGYLAFWALAALVMMPKRRLAPPTAPQ